MAKAAVATAGAAIATTGAALERTGAALSAAATTINDGISAANAYINAAPGKLIDAAISFVVNSAGEAVAIPAGAAGPTSPDRGSGMMFQGGSGGHGMDARTTGVRIMDANRNQGRRVNYMNRSGQTVDPSSGRTISSSDSRGHVPYQAPPNPR